MEIRPWPTTYSLGNKKSEGYRYDDTFYFGIRFKKIPQETDDEHWA